MRQMVIVMQVILQTARIYIDAFGKVLGWRSAVGSYCKFNRCAVYIPVYIDIDRKIKDLDLIFEADC